MQTQVHEIAAGIYRLSTHIAAIDFTFNQYLVAADEPLLFHTGMRGLHAPVSAALATVLPPSRLRWLSFGHYEADECGAMNDWLAAAPEAQVAFGQLGCAVSVADQAVRPPRPLADGEVLDLGGKRVRWIATPHVPHAWEAGLLFEETTGTLLCGDLFARDGGGPAESHADPVGPALASDDKSRATCLTPGTAPTLRRLAELRPRTLALMHGPAVHGDGAAALRGLADAFEERLRAAPGG
jgi:flavorubredoxin